MINKFDGNRRAPSIKKRHLMQSYDIHHCTVIIVIFNQLIIKHYYTTTNYPFDDRIVK